MAKTKTGGRTKGTPNKVSGEAKEFIMNFVNRKSGDYEDAFDSLEGKDKVQAFQGLLQFVIKKPKEESAGTINANNVQINFNEKEKTLEELKKELKDAKQRQRDNT